MSRDVRGNAKASVVVCSTSVDELEEISCFKRGLNFPRDLVVSMKLNGKYEGTIYSP